MLIAPSNTSSDILVGANDPLFLCQNPCVPLAVGMILFAYIVRNLRAEEPISTEASTVGKTVSDTFIPANCGVDPVPID